MTGRSSIHRRPMFFAAWALSLVLTVIAVLLSWSVGLSFTDFATPALAIAAVALVALAYGLSGRSAILSDMAHWTVLWIVFSLSAGIATYATAAYGGPTEDAAFAALDARLGFSWTEWYDFVTRYPALRFALAVAYSTLMPQIVFSIIYFGLRGRNDRNAEFFYATLAAFAITLPISWRFPALGALPYFGHANEAARFYFTDLQALRDHTRHSFSLMSLKGLITLPSFHTVLALLFVYIHRGPGVLPRFIMLLNLAVLVSIPVGGGHYLSDMISGAAVALVAIAIVRRFLGTIGQKGTSCEKAVLATAGDLGSS